MCASGRDGFSLHRGHWSRWCHVPTLLYGIPQECVAAADSNPLPRGSVAIPLAFMAKKISSHKQVLFSFALIYFLTDNIPCFLNTLLRSTRIPLLSARPPDFILGKSLASGASCPTCDREKWEEVTQRPVPCQIPGILLYCHL